MADKITIKWDGRALGRTVGLSPEVGQRIKEICAKGESKANSMTTYRSGKWHDHETGETKGDTKARYGSDVMRGRYSYVGIVYTANYAAWKDNLKNNTLLKAMK